MVVVSPQWTSLASFIIKHLGCVFIFCFFFFLYTDMVTILVQNDVKYLSFFLLKNAKLISHHPSISQPCERNSFLNDLRLLFDKFRLHCYI